jgi:hypothetical protein
MEMNEILHANIFFLIASIATVCFCLLISFLLYQLIKILQSIRFILNRIEEGSEMIAEDLSNLRQVIMQGGVVSRLMGLFFGKASSGRTRKSRRFTNNNDKSHGNKEDN